MLRVSAMPAVQGAGTNTIQWVFGGLDAQGRHLISTLTWSRSEKVMTVVIKV